MLNGMSATEACHSVSRAVKQTKDQTFSLQGDSNRWHKVRVISVAGCPKNVKVYILQDAIHALPGALRCCTLAAVWRLRLPTLCCALLCPILRESPVLLNTKLQEHSLSNEALLAVLPV